MCRYLVNTERSRFQQYMFLMGLALLMLGGVILYGRPDPNQVASASRDGGNEVQVIVSASADMTVLTDTIRTYGGDVIEVLPIIESVAARVPHSQLGALQQDEQIANVFKYLQ